MARARPRVRPARLAHNVDRLAQLAVVPDGTVISHPRVASAVTTGATQITGGFDHAQAETLAARFSTGRLPTAMRASTP
ncbi:SecDF P1 head subdomain-containing protein [Kitasatospora sp. KL5]|uniref:SecDF P1 head subdomain-containing protein n=1 Tax=Kitasatospora sp. KL5 TaxID=3425125 RepID=UPI003D6F295A